MGDIKEVVVNASQIETQIATEKSNGWSLVNIVIDGNFRLYFEKKVSEWTETTTADNLAATVTRAASVNQRHYITMFSAGFHPGNAGKLLTLKEGAVIIGNFSVESNVVITFQYPLMLAVNTAVELSLAAGGEVGNIGTVTLSGFTV